MKRFKPIVLGTLALLFLALGFSGCTPEEKNFDEAFLYGTWQEGTQFEKYLSDGTGAIWDTIDDVTEEEAQKFTWTLVTDRLTQIHLMESSEAKVPVVYTVITLNATTLVYEESTGKRHTFVKVN